MSCSIATMVSLPFRRPTSAASRCTPSEPRPEVGSSRQSSARALRERDGDLERPAIAIGEILCAGLGLVGKPDLGKHLARGVRKARCRRRRAAHVKTAGAKRRQRRPSTFSRAVNSSNSVMIWNERATPFARDPVRAEAGHVLAVEPDRAAARLHPAGEDVEEGGLAGAVRPHHAVQFARAHRKVDALQHHAVAEADMHAMASISAIARLRTTAASPSAPAGASARGMLPNSGCERAGDALGPEQDDRDEQQPELQHPGVRKAPITSRAIRKTNTPITGPQKLTMPPPTSIIMTM